MKIASGRTLPQKDAHRLSFAKGCVTLLSAVLGPLLVLSFIRITTWMNVYLVRYGPLAEAGAFLASGLLLLSLYRSKLVSSSVLAATALMSRLLEKAGENNGWIAEANDRLGAEAASVARATLVFLAFNTAVNAIPSTFAVPIPRLLRFIDLNGNGVLEAVEIENFIYGASFRLLSLFAIFRMYVFLRSFGKEPPMCPVPEDAQFPVSVYVRAMQTLRETRRDMPGVAAPAGRAGDRLLDIAVSAALRIGLFFALFGVFGLQLGTILSVVAPLGVGGLALSFAAKNLVQNMIGGGLIFLNRAFVEGDEIHSTDGKLRGRVRKIGLLSTRLSRIEGDPMLVPNSHLVDNSIINTHRRDYWLLKKNFPLIMPTFDRLGEVVQAMDRVLKRKVAELSSNAGAVPLTLYEEPVCFFDGFGHQGANVQVRAWLDGSLSRHDFYKAKSEVLLALNDAALSFEGLGIGFEAHLVGGTGKAGGAPAAADRASGAGSADGTGATSDRAEE